MRSLFMAVIAGMTLLPAGRLSAQSVESKSDRNARMTWWREARFGMFIHWGPVSLTEKEISWSRANSNPKCPNHGPTPVEIYDHLYEKFNPKRFQCEGMGGDREVRGSEVHRADGEALRRIPAVGFEGRRLQHHAHAVPPGRLRGTRQGCARRRHANRLVLLADGLARSGFSHGAERGFPEADAG